MINNVLLDYVKEVLISEPLDIFSEENETVSQSVFELVEPREYDIEFLTDDDEDDEEKNLRYIGSGNVFIAASIVCDEATDGQILAFLNESDLDKFNFVWKSLINHLKEERFIREIQPVAHSKIKLVVDNERLPQSGV
jgi:hypothetical protein